MSEKIGIPVYDKKVVNAWAVYDWANSVYSLVITSTIFPIYYTAVTASGGKDTVVFLGREYLNTALYSYVLSFSFLLIALLSPLLSGIADYSSSKKSFMRFFCYLGSAACCSLYFFDAGTLWIGVWGFALATIGYTGSIVFYNAYLPEIAPPEKQDHVSAKGFAMGYTGSSLLLIFNLVMIQEPGWFGITDDSFPARFSFLLVGIWWFGFAHITFYRLPRGNKGERHPQLLVKGYQELMKVIREFRRVRLPGAFLLAFFFYNMGVQTVMYVATLFGTKELKLMEGELITTILIIQFVAIAGAYLFSFLSSRMGNFKTLMVSLVVWVGICIGAYYVKDANGFYMVAFVVGMVMGGVQALSRSTYSKLLPETRDHASYFSFYDVCEKVGIVLGTASYGLIEELTGSMRNSIIALILFFVSGLILLLRATKMKTV